MTGRKKTKKLNYFFYHGNLHKKIHISRGADIITAWDYPAGKMCKHIYSDVRKNGERAFYTREVAEMVGRRRLALELAILEGKIQPPQHSYGLDGERKKYAYFWSEKDIMELHAHFVNIHRGRPRQDGMVTTQGLPTAAELRAMIRQNTILYVQKDDGTFVPTWQAEKI
jgi:hypothetical protein